MCLLLRDKNLWCCGPRSIEMWLANCAPCQQSSPESIADKDDTAFASTQRCTKYSVRRLIECFLHGKKARPNKAWKLPSFCVEQGQGLVESAEPPYGNSLNVVLFFHRQRNIVAIVAVMVRLERTRVCSTGSVLTTHPSLALFLTLTREPNQRSVQLSQRTQIVCNINKSGFFCD